MAALRRAFRESRAILPGTLTEQRSCRTQPTFSPATPKASPGRPPRHRVRSAVSRYHRRSAVRLTHASRRTGRHISEPAFDRRGETSSLIARSVALTRGRSSRPRATPSLPRPTQLSVRHPLRDAHQHRAPRVAVQAKPRVLADDDLNARLRCRRSGARTTGAARGGDGAQPTGRRDRRRCDRHRQQPRHVTLPLEQPESVQPTPHSCPNCPSALQADTSAVTPQARSITFGWRLSERAHTGRLRSVRHQRSSRFRAP